MRRFRFLAVVLVMVLFTNPMTVLAAEKEGIVYTVLGDSIALGIGGTDFGTTGLNPGGYAALLFEHLKNVYGDSSTCNNLAVSGLTSTQLLTGLMNPINQQNPAILEADIITVSIGGNDILQPVIPYSTYNDLSQLPQDILMSLTAQLSINAAAFTSNLVQSISIIRQLNPDATIIVNTLYNPFKWNSGLYSFADRFISQGINQAIQTYSAVLNYKVADVYTKFNEYNNPNRILVNDTFSINPENAFLHPTDLGYKLIYNLHKDLLD